jgi:hypothetical protein
VVNETNHRLDEYTRLSASISKIEAELHKETEHQQQLRHQIVDYHRKLKEVFAEYWPALREKRL